MPATTLSKRKGQWINRSVKVLVALLLLWAIYAHLHRNQDIGSVWNTFLHQMDASQFLLLILALLLMPVNWALETAQWKLILNPAIHLKFGNALKSILCGITISLFTPNRIGEYAGRLLYVDPKHTWHAIVATLVGSISQNLVNLSIGLVAVVWLSLQAFDIGFHIRVGFIISTAMLIAFVTWIYFNVSLLYPLIHRIPAKGRYRKILKGFVLLRQLPKRILAKALGYAFIRYMVFSTQFCLLLVCFGVDVPMAWLFAGVAAIFLFHTSLPLPPFIDVLARGELALLLWAGFEVNALGVMAGSLSIWIINLVIPAFLGMIFIGRVDILKSLGYAY